MTEEQVSKKQKRGRHARIFEGLDISGLPDEEINEFVDGLDPSRDKPLLTPVNPMLQLFSVCVEFKCGNKPAKMYGHVDLNLSWSGSGSCSFRLFECERKDSLPICNKGLVPLIDPPANYHAIVADSLAEINAELYFLIEGEDKKDTVVREISKSCIIWDITDCFWTRQLYSCLSEVFDGEYCSARINYIVVRRAVDATIEVSFVDGARGRNVRGKIRAYYCWFDYSCSPDEEDYYKLTLFEAESSSFLPTGKIPLRRSVLAIPGFSSLVIEADLYDYDYGKQIINASHIFPVDLDNGSSSDQIEGKIPGCSLVLKVDWKCDPLDSDDDDTNWDL